MMYNRVEFQKSLLYLHLRSAHLEVVNKMQNTLYAEY